MPPFRHLAAARAVILAASLIVPVAGPGHTQPTTVPTADLGDAPDSTNSAAAPMTAYPNVPANFPTVAAGAPPGPRHANALIVYYLGDGYSAEDEADTGFDADPDSNNLLPAFDLDDQDGWDDGLRLPAHFAHCAPTTLTFELALETTVAAPMYFNLWADWDRSGAWGGTARACPHAAASAEWAVANQVLTPTAAGRYVLTTSSFRPWQPVLGPVWLRVSVSDQPAPAADGRGPGGGYALGETEDYLFRPAFRTFLPLVVSSGSPLPPPSVPEYLPPEVRVTLPQVSGGRPTALAKTGIVVQIENLGVLSRSVMLETLLIANGQEYRSEQGPYVIQASAAISSVTTYPPLAPPPRSPAQLVVTVVEQPAGPGTAEVHYGTEGYFFLHQVQGNANQVVVYDEAALAEQTRALDFHLNAGLSSSLAAIFSVTSTQQLHSLTVYSTTDPILTEAPDTPDGPEAASPSGSNFILCPEWYVNLLDNDFGEDYGLNDDGWRARGAWTSIYVNNVLVYWNWLSPSGCANIPVVGSVPANIILVFSGSAELQTTGGELILTHYDSQANPVPVQAGVAILGAVPNVAYRPEVPAWDGFGVLSYLIPNRFNLGATGPLLVFSDDCPTVGTNNCSSSYLGSHALYLRPAGQNGWRRKFIAAHEWGHKVLAMTVSGTNNDCSFQEPGVTSSHSMRSLEFQSCAAMEGWAHFVAAEAWNDPAESDNPTGVFVYWGGTLYDMEYASDQAYCVNDSWFGLSGLPELCNWYSTEMDWMRHWWDFRTNDTASSPGFVPSHAWLRDLVEDTAFSGGEYALSAAFQDTLNGIDASMLTRWVSYGCANGIHTEGCN